jgi:hypothetical protein
MKKLAMFVLLLLLWATPGFCAWTWTLGVEMETPTAVVYKAVLTSDTGSSGVLSFADKLTAAQLTSLRGAIPLSLVMVPSGAPTAPTGTFNVTVLNNLGASLGVKTTNSATVPSFLSLSDNITDVVRYVTFTSTTLGDTKKATFYFNFYKTNK